MEGWVDTRNLNFNSARQRTSEDARLTIWRFLLERGVRVPRRRFPNREPFPITDRNLISLCVLCVSVVKSPSVTSGLSPDPSSYQGRYDCD
jgi:hypothetical protein